MNEANKNRIKDTFYTLGIEYTQDKHYIDSMLIAKEDIFV